MKNMNPIFSLKNFRSFGEEGADFELAPITALTGCNSAGKSSLVKALMLLSKEKTYNTNSFAGDRKQPDGTLKVSNPELVLGGYKDVVHLRDTNKELVFSYSMWSKYLNEEVICKRVYGHKKGVRDEGELRKLTIEKKDGTEIYRAFLDNTIVFDNDGTESVDYFLNEYDGIHDLINNIKGEYQTFLSVYAYIFYSFLEKKSSKRHPEGDIHKKALELQAEACEQLIAAGLTIEKAEKYDEGIIFEWHNINHPLEKSMWDKEYEDSLTDEEKDALGLEKFYNCVVNEIVSPWFIKDPSFIDSSSNKISRAYNVKDTDKFSVLLCELVNNSSTNEYTTSQFVNNWLTKYKIGDKLTVVGVGAGLGAEIYIHNKGVKRLLADEGYGITQLASLLLQIDLIKNKHQYNDNNENIAYAPAFISVEEPEIHLHPEYQSKLAEMFVEAYQKFNIHFIIETHSEYLIRRLQVLVADKENAITPKDISLNYVEKDRNTGVSSNRKIEVCEDGYLDDTFGEGFFDEATRWSKKLIF